MTSNPVNFRESRKTGYCEATKLWLELHCTQQRSERWNKNDNSVEFSEYNHENEEYITATLWLEQRFNNDTGVETGEKTVLKCLFEWARRRGIGAGLRVRSKTSGLPLVGDSKTIYVNESRPFWNKCLFYSMVWFYIRIGKDDLGGRHTGCERYWRPFCDTNVNLHKIFKNSNRLMKFSGIIYLYLDFTFSGWNRL